MIFYGDEWWHALGLGHFCSHTLHEIMTVNIVTICSDYLNPVIILIFAVYRITIVLLFLCLIQLLLARCHSLQLSAGSNGHRVFSSFPFISTNRPKKHCWKQQQQQKNGIHNLHSQTWKSFIFFFFKETWISYLDFSASLL